MLELIVLFCMRFHRNEVSKFYIASMEEKFGFTNIFSLSAMGKSTIGLERGGQAKLCIITEIILT